MAKKRKENRKVRDYTVLSKSKQDLPNTRTYFFSGDDAKAIRLQLYGEKYTICDECSPPKNQVDLYSDMEKMNDKPVLSFKGNYWYFLSARDKLGNDRIIVVVESTPIIKGDVDNE